LFCFVFTGSPSVSAPASTTTVVPVAHKMAPLPPSNASSGNSSSGAGSGVAPPVATKSTQPKAVGLSAADDSLSNDQKKEKLEAQLRDLRSAIKLEIKSRKGLEKLVKFYGADPVAQEKAKGELDDQNRKLSQLREQRNAVERQMIEINPDYKRERDEDDEDDGETNHNNSSPNNSNNHTKPAVIVSARRDDTKPSVSAAAAAGSPPSETAPQAPAAGPVVKAKGMYDYQATNENELSFGEGDLLTISEQDDSGWWFAELKGKTGFVPSNYLNLIN